MVILSGSSTAHSQTPTDFTVGSRRSPAESHRHQSPPPPTGVHAPFLIRNLITAPHHTQHATNRMPSLAAAVQSEIIGQSPAGRSLGNGQELLFATHPAATLTASTYVGQAAVLANALVSNQALNSTTNPLSSGGQNALSDAQHQLLEQQRQAMAAAQLLWNAAHCGLGAQLTVRGGEGVNLASDGNGAGGTAAAGEAAFKPQSHSDGQPQPRPGS
ncbi:hypothetical protein BIW11_06883, partial [Tropilaelaps mercedesae]